MKKKKETKSQLEERIRTEERERYSREKKRAGNTVGFVIIGAIIGMIFFSVVYPNVNIAGIIFGAITGGAIAGAYSDSIS